MTTSETINCNSTKTWHCPGNGKFIPLSTANMDRLQKGEGQNQSMAYSSRKLFQFGNQGIYHSMTTWAIIAFFGLISNQNPSLDRQIPTYQKCLVDGCNARILGWFRNILRSMTPSWLLITSTHGLRSWKKTSVQAPHLQSPRQPSLKALINSGVWVWFGQRIDVGDCAVL